MNTLENTIQTKLHQAIKDKDENMMNAYRGILKAVSDARTRKENPIKDPTDNDILDMIKKMVKELQKPIPDFERMGRTELAESYKAEMAVLNEFLPKMMSESEIEEIVVKAIADLGATSMKDMGKVMGFINKTYAGLVDGSVVSRIVKSKLS